jgi:hypothetical protein
MMTVFTILAPICAFFAFLGEDYVIGTILAVLSLMLWLSMLLKNPTTPKPGRPVAAQQSDKT